MAHGTVRCGLVLLSLLTLVPCRHISRDKSEQADYPRRCDCMKVIVDCTTRNGNFPTNSPVRTRELDDMIHGSDVCIELRQWHLNNSRYMSYVH